MITVTSSITSIHIDLIGTQHLPSGELNRTLTSTNYQNESSRGVQSEESSHDFCLVFSLIHCFIYI